MPRFIAALLLLSIGSTAAHAQTGWEYLDDSPERLIGLLDLPDVVRGGCGAAPTRATARVFGGPSQSSAIGTIYWHEVPDRECDLMVERTGGIKEKIPTLESGYEIPAAIVYERRGLWFRIRLPQGSGWVRRADPADFLPYPDVLRNHLANTLQGWDGTLRASPSSTSTITPLTSGWKELLDRQISVEYLGSRRVGSESWLHIRLGIEVCGVKPEGVMPVSGWIPAYRSNRSPSVWFASRGC